MTLSTCQEVSSLRCHNTVLKFRVASFTHSQEHLAKCIQGVWKKRGIELQLPSKSSEVSHREAKSIA